MVPLMTVPSNLPLRMAVPQRRSWDNPGGQVKGCDGSSSKTRPNSLFRKSVDAALLFIREEEGGDDPKRNLR